MFASASLALGVTPGTTGDTGLATSTATGDTGVPVDTGSTGTPPVTTPPTTDRGADLDSDGDGWTPRGGDCDDGNGAVDPGQVEVCYDQLDNDCNGLSDEGESCDLAAQQASLRGGGGCTGGAGVGGAAWLWLPLLGLGLWRRTRP